ncbi:hypothetical protein ACH4UV_14370 [Streptomyces sp. NPDC020802]|uniref:hypothetical protein n=1 Tax=Streptomyces sp. NPDC020802 TaxID=3365094 RepID=UPI0037B3FC37
MNALNAALPLVSVLIGSAITYLLNVRTRRRSKIEDLFHDAIAAVAVVVARNNWTNSVKVTSSAPDEHADLWAQLEREGIENYARAIAEARAALARASAYAPELKEYFGADQSIVYNRADEILSKLRSRLE